jgi:hypothetical protein
MEIYVSPIYVICAGLFIVGLIYVLRIHTSIITVAVLVLTIYTIYLHTSMYGDEYRSMSMASWIQNLAPTLLTATVVLVSIGYIILFLKKPKSSYTPSNQKQSTSFFDSVVQKVSNVKPSTQTVGSSNFSESKRSEYISALDRLI